MASIFNAPGCLLGDRGGHKHALPWETTRRLLSMQQREHTADLVNACILGELGVPQRSVLEILLQQLLLVNEVDREACGSRGEHLTVSA